MSIVSCIIDFRIRYQRYIAIYVTSHSITHHYLYPTQTVSYPKCITLFKRSFKIKYVDKHVLTYPHLPTISPFDLDMRRKDNASLKIRVSLHSLSTVY